MMKPDQRAAARKIMHVFSLLLLTLLAAFWFGLSRAEAGKCIRIADVMATAEAGGLLKEPPVMIASEKLTAVYLVMIFKDGSAALSQFLPHDGCMLQAFVGTERQARETIAAANLKGA